MINSSEIKTLLENNGMDEKFSSILLDAFDETIKGRPNYIPKVISDLTDDDLLNSLNYVHRLIEVYTNTKHYLLASYLTNRLADIFNKEKDKMMRWQMVAEQERMRLEFENEEFDNEEVVILKKQGVKNND